MNIMQKKVLSNTVFVIAAGAFGAFFRWLQLQTSFEEETGLIKAGALNYIVPLVLLCAAFLFYRLVKKEKDGPLAAPLTIADTFRGTGFVYALAFYAAAVLTAVGGFVTFLEAGGTAAPGLTLLLGLCAFVCGLSFPAVCKSSRKKYSPKLVSTLMTFPIVMFAIWLIGCYKVNASDPTLWAYAVEIVAICVVMAAFYFTAGVAFGRAQPYKAMFAAMLGAFLCISTLADSRIFGEQLMFLGIAVMLLTENGVILANMKEPAPAEEKPETPAAPAPVTVTEDSVVIKAGERDITAEPTITAPDRMSDNK